VSPPPPQDPPLLPHPPTRSPAPDPRSPARDPRSPARDPRSPARGPRSPARDPRSSSLAGVSPGPRGAKRHRPRARPPPPAPRRPLPPLPRAAAPGEIRRIAPSTSRPARTAGPRAASRPSRAPSLPTAPPVSGNVPAPPSPPPRAPRARGVPVEDPREWVPARAGGGDGAAPQHHRYSPAGGAPGGPVHVVGGAGGASSKRAVPALAAGPRMAEGRAGDAEREAERKRPRRPWPRGRPGDPHAPSRLPPEPPLGPGVPPPCRGRQGAWRAGRTRGGCPTRPYPPAPAPVRGRGRPALKRYCACARGLGVAGPSLGLSVGRVARWLTRARSGRLACVRACTMKCRSECVLTCIGGPFSPVEPYLSSPSKSLPGEPLWPPSLGGPSGPGLVSAVGFV